MSAFVFPLAAIAIIFKRYCLWQYSSLENGATKRLERLLSDSTFARHNNTYTYTSCTHGHWMIARLHTRRYWIITQVTSQDCISWLSISSVYFMSVSKLIRIQVGACV